MDGETVARAALLAAAVLCAVFDLRERRIPDFVVGPAAVVIAAARMFEPRLLLEGLAAAAAAFAALALLRAASRGRLGLGDAKLAALIGLALGLRGALVALLIASASGLLAALALIAARRLGRDDPIPFAPFLALGAAAALAAGLAG